MKRDHILPLSALAQLALFVPVVWWARRHRQQPAGEVAFTQLMQKKQTSFVRRFIQAVDSLTCSAALLNILVVPLAGILWKMRLRLEALMILATCWTSIVMRTALKDMVDRKRPHPFFVRVSKKARTQSFPSGHVVSSVCLWGWLFALAVSSKNKALPGRRTLLGISALIMAFSGPARIYLGEHWATDVIGGYLLGGGWLCLALSIYLRWKDALSRYVQAD